MSSASEDYCFALFVASILVVSRASRFNRAFLFLFYGLTTMQKQYVKYNHVHGAKQKVLGNPAQQVPPAWRTNGSSSALNGSAKGKEVQGSKIFISGLPFDVGEKEIEV